MVKLGGKRISGLARYCNDGGPMNNVVFCPKDDRVQTWGVKVLPGKTIRQGDEILVSYGEDYWRARFDKS